MSRLVLPPRLTHKLQLERAQREAAVHGLIEGDARDTWRREFNADLERIVHGMKVIWVQDPAPLDAVAQGAHPGRWNLVWPGYSGGPLTVQPLVLRDGEPHIGGEGDLIMPGSWVFDRLASMDLWSERVQRDRRRIKREAEEAKRRREEQERRDFDLECLEHWKAVSRTQVSMNPDTAWGQNARGAAQARAEKAKREKPS